VLEPFLAELLANSDSPAFYVTKFSMDGFPWEQGSNRVLQREKGGRTRVFLSPKVFNVYAKNLNTTYATFTTNESEKMKKQKVSVSLDEDLLATIDLKRGNVKRSTFLNDLIKRGLTVHKKGLESLPSQFSQEKKKEA